MKNSTISLPIQIKFISTKKENLHLSVSIYSKISDLKYLIFIEDEDHPTPEMQKLIISGRIPADYEMIENFLQDVIHSSPSLVNFSVFRIMMVLRL